MDNSKYLDTIIHGDSVFELKKIQDNSIDVVVTDPPYFLDKLDSTWDRNKVHSENNMLTVTSLPSGMVFSREQGVNLYNWYLDISKEILRVLKPGGFFFSFSSPRLYHRMASAVDDAGFEIRDGFIWLYTQNQVKAMSLNHVIKRMNITDSEKENLIKRLSGWKTPQIKSCFEPIVMGQKPKEKDFLNNIQTYEVGLFNTNAMIGENMYPANALSTEEISEVIDRVFLIAKPTKAEKGDYNDHKTVKPVSICEHLIRLTAFSKDAVVLDPFMGSGTTAVAAKKNKVHFIGIELNQSHIDIANKRLQELDR